MLRIIKSWAKRKRPKSELEDAFNSQKYLFEDRDDLTIFDVGAYIGNVMKTYRNIFPSASIYCFEPFPDAFQKLKRLAEEIQAEPHQIALSDREGKAKFHVNSDPSCNSLLSRPVDGTRYYSDKSEKIADIEVDTTTIDSFCSKQEIPHIDILKLDVEGAEIMVLSGAQRKLEQHAITVIYTEAMFIPHYEGGCMFYKLNSFMNQFGYTLFNLYNLKMATNGQLRWGDAIFINPKLRAKVDSFDVT